ETNDDESSSSLSPPPKLTEAEERKLWRKIDRKLMPILCLMYLFSFMDRETLQSLGNARLQGLATQLGLVGNQYN
ncbi:hypothetical protein L218DRAFT_798376, partial [Marasmius fiardii PR-910]